jgi:hypothetical protein
MGKWMDRVKLLEEDINPEQYIEAACRGLPVSVEWVKRVVIDEFDIEQIRKGGFPIDCLIAHIKYQIALNKIVEIRDVPTYKTYETQFP